MKAENSKFPVIRTCAMRRLRLPSHAFITLLLFFIFTSLPPCVHHLAAAGAKSGNGFVVIDDIIGASDGGSSVLGGIYSAQGFIGNIASSSMSAVGPGPVYMDIDSGFHSVLVSTPSVFDYNSVSSGSFNLNWQNIYNPDYVLYVLHISTVSDIYSYLLEDSSYGLGKNFSGLKPNTTYYSSIYANAMESDYSALVSTTLVTLSQGVSSTTFAFRDVGPVSADLEFMCPSNPPPEQVSTWALHSSLPEGLYGHDIVVYSSRVYLSGGFDGVEFSSRVYYAQLDSYGNPVAWTLAGYLPQKLYGHKTVAAKGRIYLIGGYNGESPVSEVWSAAISTANTLGQWSAESSLNSPSYFHSAVVYMDSIYVTGGFDGNSAISMAQRGGLGPDGSILSWNIEAPLSEPVFSHAMVQISSHLIVLGGNNGSNAVNNAQTCDINSDGTLTTWVTGGQLPLGIYSHSAVAMATRIFLAGGSDGNGPLDSTFYCDFGEGGFSPWIPGGQLTEPRQFHSSLLTGNRIYLLGGSGGASPLDSVVSADFLGTEYEVQAGKDQGFTTLAEDSGWISKSRWNFSSLEPNTTYYFRATSRNRVGVMNLWSTDTSTVTLAAMPVSAPFSEVFVSSITANWSPNQNPSGTFYSCEISSLTDFSNPLTSQTYLSWANFSGLLPNTTYYGRVRAIDRLGRSTRFTILGSTKTLFDPALDTSSPTISNNQSGDSLWRSINDGVYDVDFADTGGSGLKEIQVKAHTSPAEGGTMLADWTTVISNINSDSYLENWPITSVFWDLLNNGTNYISVRAIDNVNYSSTVIDAFYILKDTMEPNITVSYIPPSSWQIDYPGPVSSAAFSDSMSRLKIIQYSVSAVEFSADASVIGWTEIPGALGYDVFEATWDYNFSQLANAATNYFSLKGVDIAGNEYVKVDAFRILKNVAGPVVYISTPSALFISTLTAAYGYSTETDSKTVKLTELSLKDKTSNLYWNGSSFLSASRYWLVAAGTNPYILALDGLTLAEGRQYELVARSSDSAGNYSQLFATRTFTYDSTPPSAGIFFPSNGSIAHSPVYISGTAQDALSSISLVQISIRREDGKYWNPASSQWENQVSSVDVPTSTDWSWDMSEILKASLSHQTSYYISVRSADSAYPVNESGFGLNVSTFVYYDDTPPGMPGAIEARAGALPGTLGVYWTAPGDDGSGGYLLSGAFLIQHSTDPAVVFSTNTPSVIISTSNLSAGVTQYYEFSGLMPDTTYYFRVWARDDALNYSPASGLMEKITSPESPGYIRGSVRQSSSEPVQGIIVEAWGSDNLLKASDATDAAGIYNITGLDAGVYTVKAIWTANDIVSLVSKSDIAAGTLGVDFLLNVSYQLASISGYIPLSLLYSAKRGFALSAAPDKPRVEVYQRGRVVAVAELEADGSFLVTNLLPGAYSVRLYNGKEYSSLSEVRLTEGQRFIFRPVWNILNENRVYAYPNPSKNSVSIYFETGLPAADFDAELAFFDVSGKLVKKIGREAVTSEGTGWKITWNHSADKVASGVYIYVLKLKNKNTGEKKKTIKKMAIIR